ncbi:MAG: TonB-dependent receptor [Bacteroidales bacterium]|nr:TonB-dependent receptor [Bacteroidales bacterium]
MKLRLTIVILHVAFVSALFAQQTGRSGSDTAFISSRAIEEVSVNARRTTSLVRLGQGGELRMDMEMTQQMPRILGNADPVRFMQTLPGVQTNNEFDAGLHIQGSENGHNHVSINGVPLYNVNHMLGLFSVFIPTHFSGLSLIKSPNNATLSNRLGGFLDMVSPLEIPDSLHLSASVGPMSSQGSLQTAVGKKSALTLSLRSTYLNLLYGPLLKVDGQQLKYRFYDADATWMLMTSDTERFWIDLYLGQDHGAAMENKYLSQDQMDWGNAMGALHWQRENRSGAVEHRTLFASYYYNHVDVAIENEFAQLPSSMFTVGYRDNIRYGDLQAGLEANYHCINPQRPSLSGSLVISAMDDSSRLMTAVELSEYIDWQHQWDTWTLRAGLRLNQYALLGERPFVHLDPSLSVAKTINVEQQLELVYSHRHQYLFQSGFSAVGFPTEFWYPSSRALLPQSAHMVSLSYSLPLIHHDYWLSAEIYYKHLSHQVEYDDNIFSLLSSDYRLEDAFLSGHGYNCGLNVMLNKRTGHLKAWLSYAYTLARRRFDDESRDYWFPASHERPHELNLVMSYDINPHWQVGGTMVYASGTPFTAPECFYYINGNVITYFSHYNANRLGAYSRTDLSLSYLFSRHGKRQSGLNFSVYNVFSRKNRIYYRLKFKDGAFAYVPVHLLVETIPSINYFINF